MNINIGDQRVYLVTISKHNGGRKTDSYINTIFNLIRFQYEHYINDYILGTHYGENCVDISFQYNKEISTTMGNKFINVYDIIVDVDEVELYDRTGETDIIDDDLVKFFYYINKDMNRKMFKNNNKFWIISEKEINEID